MRAASLEAPKKLSLSSRPQVLVVHILTPNKFKALTELRQLPGVIIQASRERVQEYKQEEVILAKIAIFTPRLAIIRRQIIS